MAVANSSGPLASFNYNPDERPLVPSGTRQALRETIGGVSRSVNYSYDSLYRLTIEDIIAGPTTGTIRYGANGSYAGYDKVGNRRSRAVTGTPGQTPALTTLVTDIPSASFSAND